MIYYLTAIGVSPGGRNIWLPHIMNDRSENAWIVLYSNCSSTFLCLLRFRYVPRVKSQSGGARLSWHIISPPPPIPIFCKHMAWLLPQSPSHFIIEWATGTVWLVSPLYTVFLV